MGLCRSLFDNELAWHPGAATGQKNSIGPWLWGVSMFMAANVRSHYPVASASAGEKLAICPRYERTGRSPTCSQLYDALTIVLWPRNKTGQADREPKKIEIAPLAFMRGRNPVELLLLYWTSAETPDLDGRLLKSFLHPFGDGSANGLITRRPGPDRTCTRRGRRAAKERRGCSRLIPQGSDFNNFHGSKTVGGSPLEGLPRSSKPTKQITGTTL